MKSQFKINLILTIVFGIMPFLLVWIAFFMTFFAFSSVDVFTSPAFWGMSCIYWFIYVCAAVPAIWDK